MSENAVASVDFKGKDMASFSPCGAAALLLSPD
jgi:hypothetical protein